VCGDHVRAIQQCNLDDGGDGNDIDQMAGWKGRAGKTQHGVVNVEADSSLAFRRRETNTCDYYRPWLRLSVWHHNRRRRFGDGKHGQPRLGKDGQLLLILSSIEFEKQLAFQQLDNRQ
jgi:hypothetical protein